MTCCAKTVVVNESSSFSTMYRVLVEGAAAKQADVASVEFSVINDETKEVIQSLTALTVADVVFDSLQLNTMWDVDASGYNVKHDVPHTLLTDATIRYRLEYKITFTGGTEVFLTPIVVTLNQIYSN